MAHQPRVLLAVTTLAERAIESMLFGEDAVLAPVSSVAEADELEAEATERAVDAVLVSPQLSGLTSGHCARVRARGLRLVGLALDAHDGAALTALGIDTVVQAEMDPSAFAATFDEVPEPLSPDESTPANRSVADESRSAAPETILAVIGSKGAPGSSECAASLAALAFERWPTLLVEFDGLAGDLDVRVGADPNQGSVLGVLRATERDRERGLGELLDRWLVRADGWPPVLLGPPELRRTSAELAAPGAVSSALKALAHRFPLVVADVGFLLAEGDATRAAERTHREAIVTASAVLVVLGAREGQLRYGLDQLDVLLRELGVSPGRIRVAVNGVGAPGTPPRVTIEDALLGRLADRGLAVDAWLPWDSRALKRTSRAGAPLIVVRRRGPYARALGKLVDDLFLPTRPAPRGRKHRLAPPAPIEDEEVPVPWRA